jgi:hypothetical protein
VTKPKEEPKGGHALLMDEKGNMVDTWGGKPDEKVPDLSQPAPGEAELFETIDHPHHYGGANNPYEAIKVIEAWELGFHLGNCVKYICRAGHKGAYIDDLKKARWYLDRSIQNMEK